MNEVPDLRQSHQELLDDLRKQLAGNTEKFTIKKKTVSNLFRYDAGGEVQGKVVDLSLFDQPIYLDTNAETLDVGGSATIETIVQAILPHGLLPLVAPGFKNITIAGVIAGIGIESNCNRYGFVHDQLLEADVLLPDGRIVTASATNEYADLFYALANSFGTLGYILRAKIKLRKVKKFVTLTTREFHSVQELIDTLETSSLDPTVDYVESLVYGRDRLYLTEGVQTDNPGKLLSIYGPTIFYKEISTPGTVSLTAEDYVFRYDPEWFWGMPETFTFNLFRIFAPRSMRNSGFYKRHAKFRSDSPSVIKQSKEMLVQDWQVPWRHAAAILAYALDTIDISPKPWLLTSIKSPAKASLYPFRKDELYLNLGCYSFAKKIFGKEEHYTTKVMDQYCFEHEGTKMLYSTTFMAREEFERRFNGSGYAALKTKYDARHLLPTLYQLAVKAA